MSDLTKRLEQDDATKDLFSMLHDGAICRKCGRTVTKGEFEIKYSLCCDAEIEVIEDEEPNDNA